nr:S8 family serine peptidase [Pseudoalteromonas sp. BDTF-M6]
MQRSGRVSSAFQTNSLSVSEEKIEQLTPYKGDAKAGEGASVAIISTGVDYTLKLFGGSGILGDDGDVSTPPDRGSYLEALENGAIEYQGFPTDVVQGGWDFASENFGNDANPIDQYYQYESWNGWVYPTGLGTKLASIVHQLAPGAAIHAYKVYNVDEGYGYGPTLERIVQALEHALDPNQDGDTSDHLDIALVDGIGAAAFYNPDGTASYLLDQHLIDKASALGLTIVADAGDFGEWSMYALAEQKHRYWLASNAAVTSTIAVGSVSEQEGAYRVSAFSPKGPVRGSQALKPELVSLGENQPVALITQPLGSSSEIPTETQFISETGGQLAAARIAAAAAVIKSQYPSAGPAEIKAILANTAHNPGISESAGEREAELYSVGHGMENLEAASTTPIFVWDVENYQPYLQFGTHEVLNSKRIVKNVNVRNLSDKVQTYQLSFDAFGDIDRLNGVSISLPETISVPANQSVTFSVVVDIDAQVLNEWPLSSASDFTDENLKFTEINGYIMLSQQDKPEVKLGWMVRARPATSLTKKPTTAEYPKYLGFDPETNQTQWEHLDVARDMYPDDQYGGIGYTAYVSSFINDSKTPSKLNAYPVVIHKDHVSEDKAALNGHFIQTVGVSVTDEPLCEVTGKKFALAVRLDKPANTTLANFMDKVQERLFFYDIFHESVVEENGWNESFTGAFIWDEAQLFNQPYVSINEYGQPQTYLIDYKKEYNWNDPRGRIVKSSLPTLFTSDGRNIVSQFCLEDSFHHEIDSIEDFDQNLGIHIETDRDSGRGYGEPMAQINPVKGGFVKTQTVCDDYGWCSELTTDTRANIFFSSADEAVNETAWVSSYVAQPGEAVNIAAIKKPSMGFGIGSAETLADDSLPKFLVVSENDDYAQLGYAGYLDNDGSIIADVRQGQIFTIEENIETGTVIGQIEFDTYGFFTYPNSEREPLQLDLVSVAPNSPFGINSDYELVVANPEAFDYEHNTQLTVKAVTRQSNNIGKTAQLVVNLVNKNDVAPTVSQEIAAQLSTLNLQLGNEGTAHLQLAFDGLFTDSEGDMLSYSVDSSLSGLMVEGTELSGVIDQAGIHTVTILASDGVNEVSHTISVNVAEQPKDKNSGGFGFFILVLSSFLVFNRRR